MAGRISNDLRDQAIGLFRERVCEKYEVAPFFHQRSVWCATEGRLLLDVESPDGVSVREGDLIKRFMSVERPEGRARFVSDLGAFKVGKSFGAALWGTGFAAVPDARVSLVGLEYDICAPEFDYICEFLLSERGMSLKYDSLQNRPRDGKMWLDLANGCRFEARSWERKDSLKGKEIDAYIYCEAYQLPGIECFTGFSQNLRARRGYAYFATTPDRPWIKQLHDLGHGQDPEWHCTCAVGAEVNPFTFDEKAKIRDESLMTREKFAIHYGGKLGDFVGRVFSYERGASQFSPASYPVLFGGKKDAPAVIENLTIPPGWEVIGGADTGTFYTALHVAFSPEGDAFVINEYPNYRYVAGAAERDEGITIPRWASRLKRAAASMGARSAFWADKNTQFKQELANYGVGLLGASAPVEARTEVTREYFEHRRIHLAPWLQVLPFEIENAAWPEEASSSGKFGRVKDRDHTLDCLEHVLARRPVGRSISNSKARNTWLESFKAANKVRKMTGNVHLGKD